MKIHGPAVTPVSPPYLKVLESSCQSLIRFKYLMSYLCRWFCLGINASFLFGFWVDASCFDGFDSFGVGCWCCVWVDASFFEFYDSFCEGFGCCFWVDAAFFEIGKGSCVHENREEKSGEDLGLHDDGKLIKRFGKKVRSMAGGIGI